MTTETEPSHLIDHPVNRPKDRWRTETSTL